MLFDGVGSRVRRVARWLWVAVLFVLSLNALGFAGDDAYIAGYAAALLEQEFRLTDASLTVKNGVVLVTATSLGGLHRQDIVAALERIPGVVRVEIRIGEEAMQGGQPNASQGVATELAQPTSHWLPRGLLFDPLHADPRWPRMSVAYRRFIGSGQFENVAAPNIGGMVSLYRWAPSGGAQWEMGFQAGVYSVFDLNATSNDLLNVDYNVAIFSNYRKGNLSGLLRVTHQSSHLGDEFVLKSNVARIELAYEQLDLKLSYDLFEWMRLYGGGGVLLRSSPADMGRVSTQFGLEFTSPSTYWNGRLRPVAYADFQINERTQWSVARSLMTGVEFENLRLDGRTVQLLLEYFGGPSPDGQFYTQHVQWFGVGIHFYF
jgi:opacity protein-like surface antigen